MAVVISGTNNSDKITATDGLIDLLSSVNFASEVSVPSFKVGSDIQIGNAGIITATTLVGNVQGNINHTSNLLLQISGSEKFRVGTSGQLGIGGANYGTSGQVLTSGGSGSAATWSTISGTTINNNADNRIITGSGTANTLNGEANLTFDGTNLDLGSSQKIRIGDSQEGEFYVDGNGLKIHSHNSNSQIELESDKQFYFKYVTSGGFHFIGAGQQVLSMYGGSGGGIYFRHNNSQKLKLEGGNFTYENGATVTHASHVYIPDSIIHVGDTDTKIRFPADNTVTVEAGGHERIRIASSKILKGLTSARGNYGNNTSGVEYGVQIEGTSAITAGLSIVRNSNDANDGGIVLGKTRATSTGGNTVVQAGDDLGNLTFAGNDGSTMLFGAEIFAEVQSGVGNDDMPADLIFKTNGGSTSTTERLRITSDGQIQAGTSGPTYLKYTGSAHPTNNNNGTLLGSNNIGLIGQYSSLNMPFDHSTATTSGAWWMLGRSSGTSNEWGLYTRSGGLSNLLSVWKVVGNSNGTIDYQTFSTSSNSERLRITSGGILQQSATGGDNQFISTRTGTTYNNGDYYFQLFAKNNSSTTMGALGIVRDTGNTNSRMMFYTADGGTNKERARIHRWGGLQLRNIIPPYGSSEPASRYIYSFHRSGTYNTFWVEIKFNTPGSYCLDLRMGGYSNRHMHYTFQGYVYDGNDFASAAAIDSGNGPQRYYSNQGSAGGGSYGTIIRFGFSSMSATHPVVHYELSYGAAGGDSLAEITNMSWS